LTLVSFGIEQQGGLRGVLLLVSMLVGSQEVFCREHGNEQIDFWLFLF
jgi:hypothetical protein